MSDHEPIEAAVMRRIAMIPAIRRARGYRLYTAEDRRLLDLWQADGRAILGHRGGGVVARMKQFMDRGLLSPLPSPVQSRHLHRALARLIPALFPARLHLFSSPENALRHAGAHARFVEPVMGPESQDARVPGTPVPAEDPGEPVVIPRWRPFLPADLSHNLLASARFVSPVLPDSGLAPVTLLLERLPADGPRDEDELVRFHQPLSQVVVAAMLRGAEALREAISPVSLPLGAFRSVGPYLCYDRSHGYEARFERCLQAGVVLNPNPLLPSIIPGELSDGERALLVRVTKGE